LYPPNPLKSAELSFPHWIARCGSAALNVTLSGRYNAFPTRYHLAATHKARVLIDHYDRAIYTFPDSAPVIVGEHGSHHGSSAQRVFDLLLARPAPGTEAPKSQSDPMLADAAVRSGLNSESLRDRRHD
jgi:hypothetical protein